MHAFQAFFDGFNHKKISPRTDIKDLWRISDEIKEKQEQKCNEFIILKIKEFEKLVQRHKNNA